MSKAFTKEDGGSEPLLVRPRAPLPEGAINYVTPRGLKLLRAERASLDAERATLARDPERAADSASLAAWSARSVALDERLASAQCITTAPSNVVRFGASVVVLDDQGRTLRYEIVGVDEAAPDAGRVSFLSPLARSLLGVEVGEETTLQTKDGTRRLEVVAIESPESA